MMSVIRFPKHTQKENKHLQALWLLCIVWQDFNVVGSSNNDTGKVDGSLETKYSWKDYGKFSNALLTG